MGDKGDVAGPERTTATSPHIGAVLRQGWVGYQVRMDEAMRAAGFDRRHPDGRVLRLCSEPGGRTISAIGRALGISRQGASKLVASLVDRGFVTAAASASDRREKVVSVTPLAVEYLAAIRAARTTIDDELRASLGPEVLAALTRLTDALSGGDRSRLDEQWRRIQRAAIGIDER